MSQVLGRWGPATVFQLRVILSSSTAGHFLGMHVCPGRSWKGGVREESAVDASPWMMTLPSSVALWSPSSTWELVRNAESGAHPRPSQLHFVTSLPGDAYTH